MYMGQKGWAAYEFSGACFVVFVIGVKGEEWDAWVLWVYFTSLHLVAMAVQGL
jgi:hypothetical protein